MPTSTTNYSLQKPLVNDPVDEDLWGGYLNDDMDDIDGLLRAGITIAVAASQITGFTASASISTKSLYPCNATGGAFAATLPTAASAGNGATVFFKKTDSSSNAVTVTRASSDTIDGLTTKALASQNDFVGLVSDGVSNWSICSSAGAPLNSPAFTGTPTAPTASAGTSTTQIATTAFVGTAITGASPVLAQGYITNLSTTPVVAGGVNIASVSRVSTGIYTVTFTSAAANTYYIPVGTVTMAAHPDIVIADPTSVTTGGFTFKTWTTGSGQYDPDSIRLIVFKGA